MNQVSGQLYSYSDKNPLENLNVSPPSSSISYGKKAIQNLSSLTGIDNMITSVNDFKNKDSKLGTQNLLKGLIKASLIFAGVAAIAYGSIPENKSTITKWNETLQGNFNCELGKNLNVSVHVEFAKHETNILPSFFGSLIGTQPVYNSEALSQVSHITLPSELNTTQYNQTKTIGGKLAYENVTKSGIFKFVQ